MISSKDFQKYKVKIKSDAGIYPVYIIDLSNYKLYVYRACGYEWVDFDKIQKLIPVTEEEFNINK